MPRREKKYHYVYKTTDLRNGNFYVGMHSTDNLDDGYLGSGTRLRRAIRRHGKKKFKLVILEFLPDRSSLKERERELVNEDLLKDPKCMNLKTGGYGGNMGPNNTVLGGDKFKAANEWWRNHPERERPRGNQWHDPKYVEFMREVGKRAFLGKTHTEETRRRIGEKNAIAQRGKGNSQFGTCWITDGANNKKVKRGESIPEGWRLGRFFPKKLKIT